MKSVYLAIIGTGTVGSELLNIIHQFNLSKRLPIAFHVVCISRSQYTYYSPLAPKLESIDLSNWSGLFSDKTSQQLAPSSIEEVINYCKNIKKITENITIVDNTSDQTVANNYSKILENGINIATPNKKAFSSSYQIFEDIMKASLNNGSLVYHESSVGAGLPVISTLQDLILTGDKVLRIEGVFSGTLSFLFNEWNPVGKDSSIKFSEIVKKARDAGYTEPDPRDDLNGMDVARKVMILARIAGLPLDNPNVDFPIQSLIPSGTDSCKSANEFLEKLADYDDDMDAMREEAKKNGKYLRYIGEIDVQAKSASVKIQQVDQKHAVASLTGSDNMIAFYTERYPKNPLVIIGSGAGAAVTASGVLSDLVKIAKQV